MSATLGPIHHLMHERIALAAARQMDLWSFVTERMSPGQREQLEARWILRHSPPAGDLDDLIGAAPIHAWLQGEMEGVLLSEAQLWALTADLAEREAMVGRRLFDHGQRAGEAMLSEDPLVATDARRLLQAVDRLLLQSMPCDQVTQVVAASERAYIVRRDLLFHARLWELAGLDESLALRLQESWMKGLMDTVPGARFTRAVVAQEGRRLFDDRLTMMTIPQEA